MVLAIAPAAAPAPQPEGLTPAEARHFRSLEGKIERGLQVFHEVGMALLEIRDKRLFRLTHTSFEAYCRDRWGLERQRAYQLMGAAEVVQVLPEGPVNEAQARELVPLLNTDPKLVPQVWAAVEARNEPITAAMIREVVGEVTSGSKAKAPRPLTATEKLVASIQKVTAEVQSWAEGHPTRNQRKTVTLAVQSLVEALST